MFNSLFADHLHAVEDSRADYHPRPDDGGEGETEEQGGKSQPEQHDVGEGGRREEGEA